LWHGAASPRDNKGESLATIKATKKSWKLAFDPVGSGLVRDRDFPAKPVIKPDALLANNGNAVVLGAIKSRPLR
jgi:hypothetical protein